MNKKLKATRRKLTYFSKIYSHLEDKTKQDAFTILFAFKGRKNMNNKTPYITKEERKLIWH